jgi:hypothetical protein
MIQIQIKIKLNSLLLQIPGTPSFKSRASSRSTDISPTSVYKSIPNGDLVSNKLFICRSSLKN